MNKMILKKSRVLMSAAVASLIASQGALAGVTVDDAGKVTLYGDVRLRAEYDKREYTPADGRDDATRDRLRYRARFGVSWKATDELSANIRLATGTSDPQSPHANFDMMSHSGGDFGVDRAFVTYTGVENAKVVAGLSAPAYWQQTELFWDGDVNLHGAQASYQLGPVKLNGGFGQVDEDGITGSDAKVLSAQAVYAQNGLTVALGYAGYRDAKNGGFDPDAVFGAKNFYHLAAQYKMGPFLLGADYQASNADEGDTAYVLQGRYNINNENSVRLYYWYVEANAAHLTQDDSRSSSNFKGPEVQFKHKLSKTASVRARLFAMEQVEDNPVHVMSSFNTMSTGADNELRLRFDFDIKF